MNLDIRSYNGRLFLFKILFCFLKLLEKCNSILLFVKALEQYLKHENTQVIE